MGKGSVMSQGPCLNPNCKSMGSPHPNCNCYNKYAEGGEVKSFCDSKESHSPDCQYFAEGGQVNFIPDSQFKPDSAAASSPKFIPDNEFKPDNLSPAEAEANAAQMKESAQQERYGKGSQQLKAGLEAAGRGVAGPLATAFETSNPETVIPILNKLGPAGRLVGIAKRVIGKVNPEDIRGREEANPITSAAGTIGGLITPEGQGALLEKLGAKAVAGMAEKGILKGMTKGAVKLAAENALYQSGDEVSKMIMQDPNQTVGTAITNIGLAGALGAVAGGTLGSVNGLWKAKVGDKAGEFINDFKTRMREHLGVEAPVEVPAPTKAGIDPFTKEPIQVSPEIRPKISNIDPFTKEVIPQPEVVKPATAQTKPVESKPIEQTSGGKVADMLIKHSDTILNKTLGSSAGAALGHLSGIPYGGTVGAIIGERVLSPFFKSVLPSIGKSILEKDLSVDGFKAAADYGINVVKGEKLANSAVKNTFSSSPVIPENKRPNIETRKKLDSAVQSFQQDSSKISETSGSIGHYLPDHAIAIGSTMTGIINFLNGLRPQSAPRAPLDPPKPISKAVQAQYDRVLDIAEQPLVVVESIKNGTVTSHDIIALQTLYPALYKSLQVKLMSQVVEQVSKGENIPYDTRLGLSMFLQQPLDSTMKPMAIAMAQPQMSQQGQLPQQNQDNSPKKVSNGAANNLIKGAKSAQTASQSSEAMHSTQKA